MTEARRDSTSARRAGGELPASGFIPVRSGRRSSQIAAQIREAILGGRLLPGDRLPPERALAKIFGVSPIVLREAIHLVEVSGLLEVRLGATGGTLVADITARPVTESMSTLLRLGKVTLAQITEARLVIEPEVAALAALRRRPAALADLQQNIDQTAVTLDSPREARLLNLRYHTLLMEVSGNPFFSMCLTSLIENLEGNTASMDLRVGAVVETLEHHREITRAVERGHERRAAQAMRVHLLYVQRQLARRERELRRRGSAGA